MPVIHGRYCCWRGEVFLALLLLVSIARAQIAIEAVQDKQVLADRAAVRVLADAGYEYTCRLNGEAIPVGAWVPVDQPEYYELSVERKSTTTGAVEAKLVRFIVRAAERGDTEWGLPPWTPYPPIDSATGEFAGAHVRLIVPRDYPLGLEIPVAAFLENDQGHAVRANGLLAANGHPAIRLRRGVGSGLLAATHPAGRLDYAAALAGLVTNKTIQLETNTVWTTVSGTLSGNLEWPKNARIAVTGTITIPTNSTLTVGAGVVVRLDRGVDVAVSGQVVINGTTEQPVVFTPVSQARPWGGFVCRGTNAQIVATGAIFTGAGANATWFDQNPGYDVHRREQALFLLDTARATLTDCYAFDHYGQFGHGKDASLTLTRCLVQKFITTGEYNGGSVQINQSALIEFPYDDAVFADADNDGIYFTSGNHALRDSLVGWTKDDGIDAGSGGAGSVLVTNCWVESCYHEALAWSGRGRAITNLNCVSLNCGQGLEAGWSTGTNSPVVFADHCLSLGNVVGARLGDNYDWTYNGFLRVTNSFLLFNHRDAWGLTWSDWTYRGAQMDLRGNFLSAADTNHPANTLWNPAADGWRLAAFLTTPPGSAVGAAFATRARQADLTALSRGLPVGLSTFSTNFVSVDYTAEGPAGTFAQGTLEFAPGETVKLLPLGFSLPASQSVVRVVLHQPANAELTEPREFFFFRELEANPRLISVRSEWKFLDDGSNQETAWRRLDFRDDSWKSGAAELGFGDNDENTKVYGGPADARFATTYFRHRFLVEAPAAFSGLEVNLRRDDGAIVYLNDSEVFRSNMPTGIVTHATYTGQATTSETAFFSTNVSPALLFQGTNLVAVELHQASATSGDLSFELELIGHRPPRLEWQQLGQEVLLYWPDPVQVLEEADTLAGPWTARPVSTSPTALEPVDARFYRLRLSRAL